MRGRNGAAMVLGAALVAQGCYSGIDGAGNGPPGDSAPGVSAGDEAAGSADGSSDDGGGDEPSDACGGGAPEVSPRPLHRLTPRQYENTIRDLFGDPEFEASYDDFEPIVSLTGVRQIRTDAEVILSRGANWGFEVFACDLDGAADDACAQDFIDAFGPRAFRRPLTDAERDEFANLYASTAADLSFRDAMEVVLGTMLQASAFLYTPEAGEGVDFAPDNIRRVTDFEMASRLSYLLWDTMPDEALFDAARQGELTDIDGLRAQAERMLADERADDMVQTFIWQWMQLDGGQLHHALEDSTKDPEIFPEYVPAVQDAMRTELEALVHAIFFEDTQANFDALMTTNRAYVNASMAALYGVEGPADDDTWAWVQLDPAQRSGLLTRAAFLTVFASAKVHSPIRRGTYVVEEVLCNQLGEPPPNVDDSPVEGGDHEGDVLSVRQMVEVRTQAAECAGCHTVINPAGFPFEHYDAIGRWQEAELGTQLPIDSSGELRTDTGIEPVADALELSQTLSSSAQVRECFAGRWLHRATGTASSDVSDCDRDAIFTAFAESGDLRELFVSIVVSDAFRFINTEAEGE